MGDFDFQLLCFFFVFWVVAFGLVLGHLFFYALQVFLSVLKRLFHARQLFQLLLRFLRYLRVLLLLLG